MGRCLRGVNVDPIQGIRKPCVGDKIYGAVIPCLNTFSLLLGRGEATLVFGRRFPNAIICKSLFHVYNFLFVLYISKKNK